MIDSSEIIVSEEHIEPLRDEGYVIFKLGSVKGVVAGKRESAMLWGNVKGGTGGVPQIQSDWGQADNTKKDYIKNKPVLFSGSYSDLSGTPTIPAAQIQSDWSQGDNTAKDFIKNKPTIPSAGISDAPADGKTYGRKNGVWIEIVIPADNSVIVRIDFQSLDAFVYTCPVALKFTSQTSESTAATLSVALNASMAQFDNLTVTPTALGLVILTGIQL